MKFATIYSHDKKRSERFQTINTEDSLTQQSDAKECNINVIVKQFIKTGQIPQVQLQPLYGDFSEAGDYKTALDMVRAADEAWLLVPADVRKHFDQDPQAFIAYASDPKNLEQMRKWKLAPPGEQPSSQETPSTPSTSATAAPAPGAAAAPTSGTSGTAGGPASAT